MKDFASAGCLIAAAAAIIYLILFVLGACHVGPMASFLWPPHHG